MELKLVCSKCHTINDEDANYCKSCGTGKAGKEVTKLTELAKLGTCKCMSCGNEIAGFGLCARCRSYSTTTSKDKTPLGPYNPYETNIRY